MAKRKQKPTKATVKKVPKAPKVAKVTTKARKKPNQEDGLACMLLDIGGRRILLPKITVNEILSYRPPVPFENSPEWLLGSIDWKNWQVPVISFSNLSGAVETPAKQGSYIAVIKSLADNREMPLIGIVVYAAPGNANINEKDLVEDDSATPALGVFSTVRIGKQRDILIPDLDRLNQLAAHAAYGALPITQIS